MAHLIYLSALLNSWSVRERLCARESDLCTRPLSHTAFLAQITWLSGRVRSHLSRSGPVTLISPPLLPLSPGRCDQSCERGRVRERPWARESGPLSHLSQVREVRVAVINASLAWERCETGPEQERPICARESNLCERGRAPSHMASLTQWSDWIRDITWESERVWQQESPIQTLSHWFHGLSCKYCHLIG